MRNVRADFPILSRLENGKPLAYLDSAATSQMPRPVLRAVVDYYENNHANPYRGVYDLGARATTMHESARKTTAEFIHADIGEIIFTQNTTEALNLVACSYAMENLKEGDEIALSVAEHHSNLVPWQRVARAKGAVLRYLYPDEKGRITEAEIQDKIGPKTRVAAIAHVSNVLGLVNPVEAIVKRAHQVGAVVVLDCAQSVPHMAVDVKALDVDFAAFSGHKLYGPMGIGVLYGKRELLEEMVPFMSGGDMIQSVHEQSVTYGELPRRFEAGTRNVGGEVGLEAAIRYISAVGWKEITEHERALMRYGLAELSKLPYVTVYGDAAADDRYGVISFNIREVHPHDTATILDSEGVAVRAGHHCAQPLMEYLGIGSCCRASLCIYNTMEDVDRLVDGIRKVRRCMGFGNE